MYVCIYEVGLFVQCWCGRIQFYSTHSQHLQLTTMGFFDKAQEAVGLRPSEDQQEEMDESVFGSVCPKLTFQQVRAFLLVDGKRIFHWRAVIENCRSLTFVSSIPLFTWQTARRRLRNMFYCGLSHYLLVLQTLCPTH